MHPCTVRSCSAQLFVFLISLQLQTHYFSVQKQPVMKYTVKLKFFDKSPGKWQLLVEKLKNVGCKYSRLQIINEGFLAFLNTNEDLSRLTANEIIIDLNNNDFIAVVPQHIFSKKTVIIRNVD